jgi:hypothetical protein
MQHNLLAAAAAVALAGLPAATFAETLAPPPQASPVVIESPASWNHEVQVARRGQELLSQPVHSLRAVRLDEDVTLRGRIVNGFVRHEFKQGTALFAAHDGTDAVFCAPTSYNDFSGGDFYCFADPDAHGSFDHFGHGVVEIPGVQLVGFLENREVKGFVVVDSKPLAHPVHYSAIPADEGPGTLLRFRWRVTKPSVPASNPAAFTVEVWTEIGGEAAPAVTATSGPDGVAHVDCDGARFAILGVEADGSLRYRIEAPTPHKEEKVLMRRGYQAPTIIYF